MLNTEDFVKGHMGDHEKKPQKAWAFTCNNYSDQTIDMLRAMECKRMVFGREVGESGTPHLQGVVVFSNGMRFNAISKVLVGFHLGKVKVFEAAWNYCLKELDFEVRGDSGQGKRTDVDAYRDMVKAGATDLELCEKMPHEFMKFNRTDKMRLVYEKAATKEFRKVWVEVHWGKKGTNKSKNARYNLKGEAKDDVFTFDNWDKMWWDAYEGESTIVLDEFYGQCKPEIMQRLLEGHQLALQVRGGARYARYTKVIITSNVPPEKWWANGWVPEEQKASILDRINKVVHYKGESQRQATIYETVG